MEGPEAYETYINNFLHLQFSTSTITPSSLPPTPPLPSPPLPSVSAVDDEDSSSTNADSGTNNNNKVPEWVVDALTYAGIKVNNVL